ncbi:MAG: hypothetical protein AB1451_14380 [Nitrospirota bacterium]
MTGLVHDERGASLVAAIFLLVVVAFLGTTVVSLMSTQTMTSFGETQSTQALYVAEGGSEFTQRALAQNLNWYRSATDPIVTPATALGAGTFAVNTNLPATLLRRRVTPASLDISVFTTARFPGTGYIQLGDDITTNAEFVRYTGTTATTFTGLTRDDTIGGVNGGAVGTFLRGTRVYPVTTLAANLAPVAAACTPTPSAATIQINPHSKFLAAGTIVVETEEITYTGSSTAGGVTTLTGIVRCVNSQSSGTPHGPGYPVTTLLVDGVTPDYQTFLSSTGAVGGAPLGSATRVVQKTVQR